MQVHGLRVTVNFQSRSVTGVDFLKSAEVGILAVHDVPVVYLCRSRPALRLRISKI